MTGSSDGSLREAQALLYRLALQGVATNPCDCTCRALARAALAEQDVGERLLATISDLLHERDDLRFEIWSLIEGRTGPN